MAIPLEKEFNYYLKNQDELVKKYTGKVIAIKNEKVIGIFDSDLQAVEEVSKTEELGTFLIQKVESGSNSYTQTYHSRLIYIS